MYRQRNFDTWSKVHEPRCLQLLFSFREHRIDLLDRGLGSGKNEIVIMEISIILSHFCLKFTK
jgi:hypothetical protein